MLSRVGFRTVPNILVLSAGGYGHVPVPLVLAPLDMRRPRPRCVSDDENASVCVGAFEERAGLARLNLRDCSLFFDYFFNIKYTTT